MFQINWKTKSYLYKIFAILRLKRIFYFIQRYITKRSKINISAIDKSWQFHSEAISKYEIKNLLEVGAGKSLEQNIYFAYFFNNRVKQTVIDINRMLDIDLFNEASNLIASILNLKSKGKVKNIKDLELKYNIFYKAPCSLRNILESDQSFDICVSTTTLEHFKENEIDDFLNILKKVLKKDGYISSAIDYSDHYSHTDKNITPLNFLKYSEADWAKYNNSYLYQNRLRHRDYEKLFKKHDYIIKNAIEGPKGSIFPELSKNYDSLDESNLILWGYYLIQKNLVNRI